MKTIIYNLKKIYTMHHEKLPVKYGDLDQTEVISDGYIIIFDGKISKIGTGSYDEEINDDTKLIDGHQMIAIPGLIDAHTHLIYGGSREAEYKLKLEGVQYLDILKAGGGILNTVKATRKASFAELYEIGYQNIKEMLTCGVTTIEAKSGYGLNLETELKQLAVAKQLADDTELDIVHTFMGAHAVPSDYHVEEYLNEVLHMLEEVKKLGYVNFVDIFCEEGVFDVEQARTILTKAKKLGFKIKIHADEVVDIGGAKLASELKAHSAEHLMATTPANMDLMADNNIIANLLPGTSFNLGKEYAQAREMIERGIAVVICSDFNPGSCPLNNMQLCLQIASRGYRMTPLEVYQSATINAACSLNIEKTHGSLAVGKQADIVLMEAPNLEYTIYRLGSNTVRKVFKNGKLIVNKEKL